jgi:thioredoxin reductase (NADPH)
MDISQAQTCDALVIGAGPAGLTAATYLARFRRTVQVIDGEASRASWIPISHNLIGFTDGISGAELLARMRAQALEYGARIETGHVDGLTRLPSGRFSASVGARSIEAATVLLATGGLDVEPALPGIRDAVQEGLVRYCPICDAYEAAGRRVALIAYGKCRVKEAVLLRAYTADLTVLTLGQEMTLEDADRATLAEAGIAFLETPVSRLSQDGDCVTAWDEAGGEIGRFETIYSALGTRIRSSLAIALGAEADEDGALIVDDHLRTGIPGLWAAGDVVRGLSQINVAAAQAAIAATNMNASLPPVRYGEEGQDEHKR